MNSKLCVGLFFYLLIILNGCSNLRILESDYLGEYICNTEDNKSYIISLNKGGMYELESIMHFSKVRYSETGRFQVIGKRLEFFSNEPQIMQFEKNKNRKSRITGVKIMDKFGDALIGAECTVYRNNEIVYRETTNINGKISIPNVNVSELHVNQIGYEPINLYLKPRLDSISIHLYENGQISLDKFEGFVSDNRKISLITQFGIEMSFSKK